MRAVIRDPETAALPADVDLVSADLSEPATLEPHLDGVDSVFLLWPFFDADGALAVVEVITRHARHVVYLSAQAAAADPESFWAVLERQIKQSGMTWTFLRPTGFAKNTLGWAEQIRTDGAVRQPYGGAARTLIDERDIAAVAVRALTEDGHDGKNYVLTGPESVTQTEQVRIIVRPSAARCDGRNSPEKARPELVAIFSDESFADAALDTWAGFLTTPELVTTTVHDITGTPARRPPPAEVTSVPSR